MDQDIKQYKFFATFSQLNNEFESEKEKSKFMQKSQRQIIDSMSETGMIKTGENLIIIKNRDDGIGQAGSNRTFSFDIYVPKAAIKDPETFDPNVFKNVFEDYINSDKYSGTQVLNSNSNIKIGTPEQVRNQIDL